jgi:hypothetical protein
VLAGQSFPRSDRKIARTVLCAGIDSTYAGLHGRYQSARRGHREPRSIVVTARLPVTSVCYAPAVFAVETLQASHRPGAADREPGDGGCTARWTVLMRAALLVIALAGCSKILGINDLHGPAGNGSVDAQLDSASLDTAPSLQVSGQITQIDLNNFARKPVPNIPVELRGLPGDVRLASATTDANGQFGMTVPTGGTPIVGYVYAMGKVINAQDGYYFVRPLTGDTMLTNFVLFTQDGLDLLAQFYGVPAPSPQNAFTVAFVTGSDGVGKADIAVQAGPNAGAVRYFNAQGSIPDPSLMTTAASGIAVVFDVPPVSTRFSANQNGQQLASDDLVAKPMTTAYLPLVVP